MRYGWIALALSLGLHAVALFGVPLLDFSWLRTDGPRPAPIEARIVQAVPPADIPRPPRAPAVAPKPPPKPRPAPAPVVAEAPAISIESPEPPPAAVNEQLADGVADQVASRPATGDGTPPGSGASAEVAQSEEPAAVAEAPDPAPSPGDASARETAALAPAAHESGFTAPVHYPISHARIVYDLRYGATPVRIGTVRHTFSVDGAAYRAETVAEASGIFAILYGGQYVQRSTGRLGPSGLIPEEYFVMRGRPDRAERATFDWSAKTVSFSRRNETETKPVASGVQDPISMLHQLYFYQPLPQTAFLDIATSRKVNTYSYEFLGEVLIETPIGIVNTVHLRREDQDADRLELWLDPRRAYLPMRLHYVDRKGTIFDQIVREVGVEPAPAASR